LSQQAPAAFGSEKERQKVIVLCSVFAAVGWGVTQLFFELLFGPHVQQLRMMALGAGVGAVVGLLTSTLQWFALRGYVRESGWWIAVSTAGSTLAGLLTGLFVYVAIANVDVYTTTIGIEGILAGCFAGLVAALTQWLVLRTWNKPDLGWRSWVVPVVIGSGLAAPVAALAGTGVILLLLWLLGPGAWPLILTAGYLTAGIVGGIIYGRFVAWGFKRTLPAAATATAASGEPLPAQA
jgi:hypothetical protein